VDLAPLVPPLELVPLLALALALALSLFYSTKYNPILSLNEYVQHPLQDISIVLHPISRQYHTGDHSPGLHLVVALARGRDMWELLVLGFLHLENCQICQLFFWIDWIFFDIHYNFVDPIV
jgi:hypothetical protein